MDRVCGADGVEAPFDATGTQGADHPAASRSEGGWLQGRDAAASRGGSGADLAVAGVDDGGDTDDRAGPVEVSSASVARRPFEVGMATVPSCAWVSRRPACSAGAETAGA